MCPESASAAGLTADLNISNIKDVRNLAGRWLMSMDEGVSWQEVSQPEQKKPGKSYPPGLYLFKKDFSIAAECLNEDLTAVFGAIDDDDETFINNIRIGGVTGTWAPGSYKSYFYLHRFYHIPRNILKEEGLNTILIKVNNFERACGIMGDELAIVPSSFFINDYVKKFSSYIRSAEAPFFIFIGVFTALLFWYLICFIFTRERFLYLLMAVFSFICIVFIFFSVSNRFVWIDNYFISISLKGISISAALGVSSLLVCYLFNPGRRLIFIIMFAVDLIPLAVMMTTMKVSILTMVFTLMYPVHLFQFVFLTVTVLRSTANRLEKIIIGTGLVAAFLTGAYDIARFFGFPDIIGSDNLMYGMALFAFSIVFMHAVRAGELDEQIDELKEQISGFLNKNRSGEDIYPESLKKAEKAAEIIRDNYKSDISREGIASLLELHPDYLGRVFKSTFGMSLNDYINFLRIREAERLLAEDNSDILAIAERVGFQNLSTFYRVFRDLSGISPRKYRKLNQNTAD